ncbi:MAG: zinc-ribbon domain-containing protein [Pseudomonadota bacterium]
MRLVCPNCDATYEVPDSVIPPEGRDVQCSNCGKAWFFNPNVTEDPETEVALEPEPVVEPEPEPEPEKVEIPPAVPPDPPMEDEGDAAPEDIPTASAALQKRSLNAQIADVLRQEAEYEARARAEESGLEYQDDLPLDDPPKSQPDGDDDEAVATASGSRRDLLPDIDEINSTLRATSERKASETPAVDKTLELQSKRKGFRIGFGLMLFVLGSLAALYSYSAPLSESVPSLAGPLSGYVEWVNGGRLWLQDAMETLAAGIDA